MSNFNLDFRPDDYFQNKENEDSTDTSIGLYGFVNSGQYLPKPSSKEIEICRLVINSATIDITSLRVRRQKDRYIYKMVDEYSSKFVLPIKTSIKTLKMKDIIKIFDNCERIHEDFEPIDNIGLIKPKVVWDKLESKKTSDEINGYLKVESSFYPEIENYYLFMIEKWVEEI
tara:strand:- start:338 stop:853 length:516 start_codon:yes stop_codon:yes gene_type:complete